MNKLILILSLSMLSNLAFAHGSANINAEDVSLMQLIVNPEKYHGKLVRVVGVSRIEFEGNGIWFSKEHYRYRIYKNSLWISPDYKLLKTTPEQLKVYNGQYVIMEGIFNKDIKGHMALNSGSLQRVSSFELYGEFEKPANQKLDPIVTTPVDEVEAQSTQGHP